MYTASAWMYKGVESFPEGLWLDGNGNWQAVVSRHIQHKQSEPLAAKCCSNEVGYSQQPTIHWHKAATEIQFSGQTFLTYVLCTVLLLTPYASLLNKSKHSTARGNAPARAHEVLYLLRALWYPCSWDRWDYLVLNCPAFKDTCLGLTILCMPAILSVLVAACTSCVQVNYINQWIIQSIILIYKWSNINDI